MIEVKASEKIRIKDIAEKAGVSVGTVDRVLHDRPNVSIQARERVEEVLKAINYQPNMYASALASNKKYQFICMLPIHEAEAYWTEVEHGMETAITNRSDFHLALKIRHYKQFDTESFQKVAAEVLAEEPDGVVVVPQEYTATKIFCNQLQEAGIPYILLDSNLPDLKALAFFGQDSLKSGYFATRMLMLEARNTNKIALIRFIKNRRLASKQQEYREMGFKQYMYDYFRDVEVAEVNLEMEGDISYDEQLDVFFEQHPDIHHGITFSSWAYVCGEYLLHNNRRDFSLVGYDMIERNVECLRKRGINFIIAQHPWRQGYNCIKTLFNHLVLKQEIVRDNYMPIELISAENYTYYNRR